MTPTAIDPEIQELLARWVQAVENKDLEALSTVFRDGPDLAVFWSNGERNVGWDEVQQHIEIDFRKDVELTMDVQDIGITSLGDAARVLTYRYSITITVSDDSVTFHRLASMTIHRDPDGWRVAAMHVSTAPTEDAPPN